MPKRVDRKTYNHGEMMDVEGIAKQWDEYEEVRDRIRGGGGILHPDSSGGEDVKTAALNYEVLAPMMARMASSRKMGHPPVDKLRVEVEQLFTMNKRVPLPPFGDLHKMAWRLRFLACWVKMKTRRAEPSKDSRLNCALCFFGTLWCFPFSARC